MAPKAAHLKSHAHPIKITRRRCRRETTITTTPTPTTPDPTSSAACTQSCNLESHSPETSWCCNLESHSPETSWCYSASKPPPPPSPHSDLKIRNPNPTMGPYAAAAGDELPSSLSKFNSALTAGLLNPMSPPPPPDKTRSSPTLFEMMANEPDSMPRAATAAAVEIAAKGQQSSKLSANVDKQTLMQQRLVDLLACRSPGNQFNDAGSSDLMLTLSSKDGVSVCISVHRQILVVHSRFFALKLNESWVKQQGSWAPYSVEIADCDDIEVYIETLRLMYSKDLRRKLMKEDVSRVLGILRVSVAIGFDAGVLSCLEYLEAAPWAEDEEEKVASLVSELRLEGVGAGEVLKRVSLDATAGPENGKNNDEVLLKLLHVVLEGKDEKARRDMKGLVTKLLRENSSHNDLRKESLYSACDECLKLLSHHFLRAADGDMQDVGQIARQADNLHWLIDILVDRQIAEKILETWASETDVSEAHSKVPPIHRYEVSRVTARLFVGIGKREVLASKEARCMLLKTWLVPFYEDFRWMGRASRGLDRHSIEEGLSNTISTLPMALQQEIFVSWFNRFVNGGDDCPNIQRGFEVWWRRAFLRRNGEVARPDQMRIVSDTMDMDNS